MVTEKKQVDNARAVGRRKTASARVKIMPGKGTVLVNGKSLEKYFPLKNMQDSVLAPFEAVGRNAQFDASAKVAGGGPKGQCVAVRHGIARALVEWNPELKAVLKAEGYLTRDPRAKERKKFGLRKARRAHQWRKR